MTKETEIVKLLRQYMTAFPSNANLADGAWAIYARALSSLTLEEINAAMLKLLRTSKFFPSVAEIFQAAKSVREYADGTKAPTAAEAWEEVQRLAKQIHLSGPWDYSCPEVKRAAECFGRYELCTIEENAVSIARSQFIKIYNEIVSRRKEDKENEAVLEILPSARAQLAKGKIIELAEARRVKA